MSKKNSKFNNIVPKHRPLTKQDLSECQETARSLISQPVDFVYDVVPYTGLTMDELLHLLESWIIWGNGDMLEDERPPKIVIPPKEECRNFVWADHPPDYKEKKSPCGQCLEFGSTNQWEVRSEGDSSPTPQRSRTIPVLQPRAQKALHRWFRTQGRPGIPYTTTGLSTIMSKVSDTADVNREISYKSLKFTFIYICAEQGVPKDEIERMMPYDHFRLETREILRESSTNYDLVVQAIEILHFIENIGEVTTKEISKNHGTNHRDERRRVNTLIDHGLLRQVGVRETPGRGGNPPLYSIEEGIDLEDGIPCTNPSCEKKFRSLQGRSDHLRQIH